MKADKIPAQRRKLTLALLHEKGVLSVHQISQVVGMSLPTTRRELELLVKTGAIDRSHSGATFLDVPLTKRYMVTVANNVLMLAKSCRFGQTVFFKAFDVDERFENITARRLPKSIQRDLEKKDSAVTSPIPEGPRSIS